SEDLPIRDIHHYLQQFGQAHTYTLIKDSKTSLHEVFQEANVQLEKGKLFGKPTMLTESTSLMDIDIQFLWDRVRVIEYKLRNHEFSSIDEQVQQLTEQIRYEQIPQRQLFRFLMDVYYALIYKLQESKSQVIKIENMEDYFDELK